MTPDPKSKYLPPLDECLSGQSPLLSWKAVYEGLSATSPPKPSHAIIQFLVEKPSVKIYREPLQPFPANNQGSKQEFDAKTAVINIPQSGAGRFDINQIKEDALWLSAKAKLDEVISLRIAILEWQNRSKVRLLSGFTEEEVISVQDAAGTLNFGACTFLPGSSIITAPVQMNPDSSSSQTQRRFRIWTLYLSERVHVIRVSEILFRIGFSSTRTENESIWKENPLILIGRKLVDFIRPKSNIVNHTVSRYVQALRGCFENYEKGCGIDTGPDENIDFESIWRQTQILIVIHLLQSLYVLLRYKDDVSTSEDIESWFNFTADYSFFAELTLIPSIQHLLALLQSLLAVVSLDLMNMRVCQSYLNAAFAGEVKTTSQSQESVEFLTHQPSITKLTNVLLKAMDAGPNPMVPSILAWSFLLGEIRGYAQSLIDDGRSKQSLNPVAKAFIDAEEAMGTDTADIVPRLARFAADQCQGYSMIAEMSTIFSTAFSGYADKDLENHLRLSLLDFLCRSLDYVQYSGDIVLAALAIISGARSPVTPGHHRSILIDDVAHKFYEDDVLRRRIFDEAMSRFPHETLPFLKICRAFLVGNESDEYMARCITQSLEDMHQYTQTLPVKFGGFETMRDDENAGFVRSTGPLPLFSRRWQSKNGPHPSKALVLANSLEEDDWCFIPPQTDGIIADDSSTPPVVSWASKYSALRYLARLLFTLVTGSETVEYLTNSPISIELAAEIVALFASLLSPAAYRIRAGINPTESRSAAQGILNNASLGFERERDVVSIILDIFEQELQRQRNQVAEESSLELLASCSHCISILATIVPHRIWPFLSRSELLDIDGSGGTLAIVVGSSEIVVGRYDFLIGCIHMFEALIFDVVTYGVSRKSTSKALTRFESVLVSSSGSSEKSMGRILVSFTKTMIGVFEGLPNWRFSIEEQKLTINTSIMTAFTEILEYVYGFDDNKNIHQKLTAILAPSAEYLVAIFLSPSTNNLPINPIIETLMATADEPTSTLFQGLVQAYVDQTHTSLSFLTTILRVSILLGQQRSHLQKQLFNASPVLARIFAGRVSLRAPTCVLLETLVRNAALGADEPPSLLGHMGPETAKCFLSLLSGLTGPEYDKATELSVWNLLSAVVGNRQQWFAIYLLTGQTARESLRKKDPSSAASGAKPVLKLALDELSEIASLDTDRTLAILDFVITAQNHWPWATNDLSSHPHVLKRLADFVASLPAPDWKEVDFSRTITTCRQLKVASCISEILAMYLHSARRGGDVSMLKDLGSTVAYFKNNGVRVPDYNSSLHTQLKSNVEKKFNGCKISSFKRTLITRSKFGANFFYDLTFASTVLRFDQAWVGKKQDGFVNEFARANVNLSLVDAQVSLVNSWKLLATELSYLMKEDQRLSRVLAHVAGDCLRANSLSRVPQPVFQRLIKTRIDLAFTITQRLVDTKSSDPEVKALFDVTWEAIRESGVDFETAFTGEDAHYYRSLIRILFLSLHPHIPSQTAAPTSQGLKSRDRRPERASEIMEILSKVIAQGFRALSNQLHDNPQSCSADDFVLLTALFQTILRIPHINTLHSQISLQLANYNVSRYAASLFSWSHELAIDRDPIYGELSILFLLELSSVRPVAESLAVEGILSQLSSATIINYFRRPKGMGPFDEPTRVYSIWTRGLLPLCLNLLDAVGATIAAEIAAFLNQFPSQLARAATAFSKPHAMQPSSDTGRTGITLGLASEVHSLSLLSVVIDQVREGGAGAGIITTDIPSLDWDKAAIKEDVDGWLQGRKGLRERIVPSSEREVEMAKMKPRDMKSGADSRLEERVIGELVAALECLNSNGGFAP
ncbi:hypothetical protein M501DRAFT_956769 [Patellaria atrata CBS 101060]|uniref:Nucleoporin n=1 Tax=Patellaria atrata CBS 101060 TaxID=1346257 RepID=A0A9P4VQH8_9PEZI|nr:hypothetical protein M501DRAFT_956769 [Patellaria atrata CBS 101060]